jgi:hypothetical protein
MKGNPDLDIERQLKNIEPLPLPPGLRGRVLAGAAKLRTKRASLSPLLRKCLISSIVIFAAALTADPVLSHRESDRIAAIVGSSVRSPDLTDDPMLRIDVLAILPDIEVASTERGLHLKNEPNSRQTRLSFERELIKEKFDAL